MAGRRPTRRNEQRAVPTRRAGRRRRLALSILIAFVLLESGLRILLGNFGQSKVLQRSDDPEICLELQPEAQMLYTGWRARVAPSRMVINSYGIRGPELEEDAEEGVLRIGALGDSFTFGQGVDYHESFPSVASRTLKGSDISNEMLNFGVPGHATPQSVALARSRLVPLEPDLVLLNVFANDLSAVESYCAYGQGDSLLGAWILRNVYLGRLLYLMLKPLTVDSIDPADHPELGTPPERFVRAIESLEELGRTHDFLVAVVLLTDRSMFLEQRFCPDCVPAHDLVGKTEVKVIDLSTVWEELQTDIPDNFITGEDHLSVAGNQQMGKALAKALLDWDAFRRRAASRGRPAP